jgi:hypothetical protein
MKYRLAAAALVVVALVSGCGSDSQESLAGEQVSTMEQANAVLDKIKDESSAKAHKAELQSLMQKLNEINQRQVKLPAPTEADLKAMDAKYGKPMEEAARKYQTNMMRIAFDPKINSELQGIDLKTTPR